ncbi:hypothetical protein CBR64_09070 [Cellulosimicrobium cellulans]|uniref:Uncharacterized protein n=1 Tax=Cellulosimicrobium cellulans TaxID=1710 RepID=A0A1Y0HWF9_CELCE|nr:hypothetical protein CBR64_09070 [Cellulosimicrobium cellulans]
MTEQWYRHRMLTRCGIRVPGIEPQATMCRTRARAGPPQPGQSTVIHFSMTVMEDHALGLSLDP